MLCKRLCKSNMMQAKRLPYLDSIKGVLIILVIIGHAIQFCIPDYEQNFCFRFIYSFHMPWFFFVSGYLANRGYYNSSVIGKRACQLLIPFIVWAFFAPLLQTDSIDIDKRLQVLIYPDKGLWFLYNLFVYSAIFNIAEFLEEKYRIRHIVTVGAVVIILYVLMFLFHTKFNCSQLCYHIIFYGIGYYYKWLQSTCVKYNSHILNCLFGVVFALTVPFWTTNGEPLFYQYINLGGTFSYLYRYGVQVVGMLFFYNLGERYLNRSLPILQKMGISTLGIYAVQFTILRYLVEFIPIELVLSKIIVVSIIAIPLSYFAVVLIRKVKYVRLLLIGEK